MRCALYRRHTPRAQFGNWALGAFLIAQALDGALTYLGVVTFGVGIEANPIVAWYVTAVGAGLALIGVKLLAVACAAALHWQEMHRTLGALTVLYLAAAILPWARVFWMFRL